MYTLLPPKSIKRMKHGIIIIQHCIISIPLYSAPPHNLHHIMIYIHDNNTKPYETIDIHLAIKSQLGLHKRHPISVTVKSFYFVGYLITWNSWARCSTNLSTNDIKSPRLDFRIVNNINIWYESCILQVRNVI